MIDETLFEAEEKMESAVEHAKEEFAAIRTGRATPAMFSKIVVDYYGALTPITQMASVGVPEPRMVIVKPYDASQLGPIERAIRDSDLGVNPNNEGTQLRIHLPQMTEERRREMIKVARHKAEEGRVAIRNVRRKAKEQIDRLVKDGETGFLFKAGDARSLAAAVDRVLSAHEARERVRANARRFVECERTWAASVGHYAEVFERLALLSPGKGGERPA